MQELGCPWNGQTLLNHGCGQAPRGVAVGAGARLPVRWFDLLRRCFARAPSGAGVVAGARLPEQ